MDDWGTMMEEGFCMKVFFRAQSGGGSGLSGRMIEEGLRKKVFFKAQMEGVNYQG